MFAGSGQKQPLLLCVFSVCVRAIVCVAVTGGLSGRHGRKAFQAQPSRQGIKHTSKMESKQRNLAGNAVILGCRQVRGAACMPGRTVKQVMESKQGSQKQANMPRKSKQVDKKDVSSSILAFQPREVGKALIFKASDLQNKALTQSLVRAVSCVKQ